jgi:hypothetical protein
MKAIGQVLMPRNRRSAEVMGTARQQLDCQYKSPLRPGERVRDARPGGPPPQIPDEPPAGQRRVSRRGVIMVAGQKIGVGITHAGLTVTVHATDTSFRIHDGDQLLVEAPRTTAKPIARFKARKPEPPRQNEARAARDSH